METYKKLNDEEVEIVVTTSLSKKNLEKQKAVCENIIARHQTQLAKLNSMLSCFSK